MAKLFQGKTAFITGGARGIGRATALKLAKHGCDIAFNYYNSSGAADELCAELTSLGVKSLAIQGNVADPSSIVEMAQNFAEHFQQCDFLISNAASGVLKPALEMTLKHWRWCLETNAFALVSLVQQFVEKMPPGSRVLTLSSIGAQRAVPDYAFIGAAKAALESLVRSLTVELAPRNIAVNTISAGVVDTDALKHFPKREFLLDQFKSQSVAGRDLTPEDVADVIYLLCLPESALIRGQTIFVDAGYNIIG